MDRVNWGKAFWAEGTACAKREEVRPERQAVSTAWLSRPLESRADTCSGMSLSSETGYAMEKSEGAQGDLGRPVKKCSGHGRQNLDSQHNLVRLDADGMK